MPKKVILSSQPSGIRGECRLMSDNLPVLPNVQPIINAGMVMLPSTASIYYHAKDDGTPIMVAAPQPGLDDNASSRQRHIIKTSKLNVSYDDPAREHPRGYGACQMCPCQQFDGN